MTFSIDNPREGCNNPPLGKYVRRKPSGEQGLMRMWYKFTWKRQYTGNMCSEKEKRKRKKIWRYNNSSPCVVVEWCEGHIPFLIFLFEMHSKALKSFFLIFHINFVVKLTWDKFSYFSYGDVVQMLPKCINMVMQKSLGCCKVCNCIFHKDNYGILRYSGYTPIQVSWSSNVPLCYKLCHV